ncbi:hypothetical protein GDO81_004143 [Engystomops pustulosus]|uniref:Secreted protein n=1 Tax=Engystomops pustulosus TaxID=76066 RepID=A0AAV6ZQD4_ENGPU|nr:hypothetical protein GDO81_004143 [Engystomops pustulosus]
MQIFIKGISFCLFYFVFASKCNVYPHTNHYWLPHGYNFLTFDFFSMCQIMCTICRLSVTMLQKVVFANC